MLIKLTVVIISQYMCQVIMLFNLFYKVTFQYMGKENFQKVWVKRPEKEIWRKKPFLVKE